MATYSLAQFLSHAAAGDPIIVKLNKPKTDLQLDIGGQSIVLSDGHFNRTVDGNNNINPNVVDIQILDTLDLGTVFTAQDIIESTSLRIAVSDGLVLSDQGSQPLVGGSNSSWSSSSSSMSCSSSSSSCSFSSSSSSSSNSSSSSSSSHSSSSSSSSNSSSSSSSSLSFSSSSSSSSSSNSVSSSSSSSSCSSGVAILPDLGADQYV